MCSFLLVDYTFFVYIPYWSHKLTEQKLYRRYRKGGNLLCSMLQTSSPETDRRMLHTTSSSLELHCSPSVMKKVYAQVRDGICGGLRERGITSPLGMRLYSWITPVHLPVIVSARGSSLYCPFMYLSKVHRSPKVLQAWRPFNKLHTWVELGSTEWNPLFLVYVIFIVFSTFLEVHDRRKIKFRHAQVTQIQVVIRLLFVGCDILVNCLKNSTEQNRHPPWILCERLLCKKYCWQWSFSWMERNFQWIQWMNWNQFKAPVSNKCLNGLSDSILVSHTSGFMFE